MHDIDFLPIEYRQQHARRQVQPWRVVVVIVFLGLLTAATFAHYHQRWQTDKQLAAIVPCYESAVQQNHLLAETQSQLQTMQSTAELFTYLRHPWPRTQMLAALRAPLPKEITLSQLQILRENPAEQTPAQQRPPDKKTEEEKLGKTPPAQRDLQRFRDELDKARTLVRITGTSSDTGALHGYLGALGKSDLFAKADLRSIESIEGKQGTTCRFQAMLVVRPGYGQPGGPGKAESDQRKGKAEGGRRQKQT
jgi:Tfp pilus assembly protein PilN